MSSGSRSRRSRRRLGSETALAALLTERGLDVSAAPMGHREHRRPAYLTISADGRSTTEPLRGRGASGTAAALGRELAAAQRALLAGLILRDRYDISRSGTPGWWPSSMATATASAAASQPLPSQRAAAAFVSLMATWAAHQRAIVVEHLLLRPKFPGDALYPACTDGPGCLCGDGGSVLVPAHLRDARMDGAVQHEPEHARLRRPDDPGADPVAPPRQDLLGGQ